MYAVEGFQDSHSFQLELDSSPTPIQTKRSNERTLVVKQAAVKIELPLHAIQLHLDPVSLVLCS